MGFLPVKLLGIDRGNTLSAMVHLRSNDELKQGILCLSKLRCRMKISKGAEEEINWQEKNNKNKA